MRDIRLLFSLDNYDETKAKLDSMEGRLKAMQRSLGLPEVGSGFEQVARGAAAADKQVQSFGTTAQKAVGVLAGGVAAFDISQKANKFVQEASRIADAMSTAGAKSAEGFQRIVFAAGQSGASLEQVVGAFTRMNDNLGDPSKGTLKTITDLGLSFEYLKTLGPEQQFLAIGNAVAALKDPNEQVERLNDLLGRGGAALLPAFKAGIEEVGRAAPVMSAQVVKAGDDAGDKFTELQGRIDVLTARAMTPLLESFLKLPDGVQVAAAGVYSFMPSLSSMALGIMAAGGPVAAVGMISKALTALAGLLTLPAGLVVAAIIGAVAVWKYWDTIGPIVKGVYDAVKHWLVDKFNAIVGAVKEKVDAVTGFFANMYDKVVGNSYVPDMIVRIKEEFDKLQAVMVGPTRRATQETSDAFGEMEVESGSRLERFSANMSKYLSMANSAITDMDRATSSGSRFRNALGGAATGAQYGAEFGPWGAIIGAGAGAVFGALRGINGPSQQELEGRGNARAFEDSLIRNLNLQQQNEAAGRRWAEVTIAVRDAYLAVGHGADEAERDVAALWAAEKEGPEATERVIRRITATMKDNLIPTTKDAEDSWKRVTGAIEGAAAAARTFYDRGTGQTGMDARSMSPEAASAIVEDFLAHNPQVSRATVMDWLAGNAGDEGRLAIGGDANPFAPNRMHTGGMVGWPRAHNGLAVDEVPIIAQRGEGILSRLGMRALGGPGVLNTLNRGKAAGDITVNLDVYVDTTMNESELGRRVTKALTTRLRQQGVRFQPA